MKIGIVGHKGRIGQILVEELQSGVHKEAEYAGGVDKGDDAEALFLASDAVIDFTSPEATVAHA